jgi:hypothetical protein
VTARNDEGVPRYSTRNRRQIGTRPRRYRKSPVERLGHVAVLE